MSVTVPFTVSFAVMLLSYSLAALATHLWLFSYLANRPSFRHIPIALGLGPLMLSVLQELLLFAGIVGAVNIALIFTLLFVLILLRITRTSMIRDELRLYANMLMDGQWGILAIAGLLGLAAFWVLVLLEGYLFPLDGNDPLEYATSARLLVEKGGLTDYPFVDSSKTGGYYGPWTHPLGYVNLMVWGFFIQGSADSAGVIKLIAPYFSIATSLLVFAAVYEFGRSTLAATVSALSLFLTPIYLSLTFDSHIDPVRLFSMLTFVLLADLVLDKPRLPDVLLVGVGLGLTLYSHSINLIFLPMFCVLIGIYATIAGPRWRSIVIAGAAVIAISLLPVLPRFISNISVFGAIIADAGAVPLWSLEHLDYEGYFRVIRGIDDYRDRVLSGGLKPLTDFRMFGIWHWALVSMTAMLFWGNWSLKQVWLFVMRPEPWVTCAWCFLGFYGMVLVSLILDLDIFIKNVRYMLTPAPIAAVLLGCVMTDLLKTKLNSGVITMRLTSWLGPF